MKKILFITSSFGYTGSEMLLWYSLCHLDKEKFKPYLFSKERGRLIAELPAHIENFVAYRRSKNIAYKALRLILKTFKIDPVGYQLRRIQKRIKAEYWYVNTIVNPEVYQVAASLGIKVITHVHELPMAYGLIRYNDMKDICDLTTAFIGCSQVVCSKIEDMGHKNVHLFYGFVDQSKVNITKSQKALKTDLVFGEKDYVWAISGKTTLIKGIDFLIPLLKLLPEYTKILWIGGQEDTGVSFYVKRTIELKFPGRVIFTGEQKDDYYNYMNCADAFLLLSREDSFPLVMLEAAVLGKPIVGFNSGGIKEFVRPEMGIVVDSWNFNDLASAMQTVQDKKEQFDPEFIKQKAANYDVSRQVKNWEKMLERI